ncbi:unnamed protein product [Arabidopsis thaliana]|uniref:Phytocyanin domain-containing protein n=1 Tax=Arabidopsis thaliana TaxID=3702 RepID=A0A654FVD5_ARATH|nr:unnamed protein product [Arabidopsis thaliana]
MGLSAARKLLVFLMVTVFLFSGSADAWSWSWGSGQSGSNGDWMELWRFFWLGFWWFRLQLGWFKLGLGMELGRNRYKLGLGKQLWLKPFKRHWLYTQRSQLWLKPFKRHWLYTQRSQLWLEPFKRHWFYTQRIAGPTHNGHSSGSNHSSIIGSTHNHTAPSLGRKIAVTVWKNGYGYTEWTAKHAPFYVNDVLVFTYNNNDQTQSKTKHHHNKKKNDAYLLPDMKSFKRCDVARGKKLVARGGSSSRGFRLLLRKVQTYYFVSGDQNDCNHNMKFSVHPIPHPSSHQL